jgi:hypothetical protein
VSRVLKAPEIALLALLEVVFGVLWAWLGAGEAPSVSVLGGGAAGAGAGRAGAGGAGWACAGSVDHAVYFRGLAAVQSDATQVVLELMDTRAATSDDPQTRARPLKDSPFNGFAFLLDATASS